MKLQSDQEIGELLEREIQRQQRSLSLIASENIVSDDVLDALSSGVVNKTVEGFPGRRFHAGCHIVDEVEEAATRRAKALFGAAHANVQAHSGTQANQAALSALSAPGARLLSMALADGGHLSHGAKFNFSGLCYEAHHYSVDPITDLVDLQMVRELAHAIRPDVIIAGASSYTRDIDYAGFAAIAAEVGARLMVDVAHFGGLIAAKMLNDPVPHADIVTMSTYKGLRGPRGGLIVSKDPELETKINRGIFPFAQGTAAMNAVAAKAVCLHEASQPSFIAYCHRTIIGAQIIANELLAHGITLVTGGTDTSMVMVDLRNAEIDGDVVTRRLEQVGILANRNLVPRDKRPASETSGVRLSSMGVTSRGLPLDALKHLANIIAKCSKARISEDEVAHWKGEIRELCDAWPLSPRGTRLAWLE